MVLHFSVFLISSPMAGSFSIHTGLRLPKFKEKKPPFFQPCLFLPNLGLHLSFPSPENFSKNKRQSLPLLPFLLLYSSLQSGFSTVTQLALLFLRSWVTSLLSSQVISSILHYWLSQNLIITWKNITTQHSRKIVISSFLLLSIMCIKGTSTVLVLSTS
jgi:hypothetical protein